VANPSLCDKLRYGEGAHGKLNYSALKITGDDAQSFLQGQTTNNVNKLGPGEFHWNTLLDIGGRIQSYFLLLRNKEDYLLFTTAGLLEQTVERLEKYIIMEEVEVEKIDLELFFSLRAEPEGSYLGNLFGEPAWLTTKDQNFKNPKITEEELSALKLFSGFPINCENTLLNETILNLWGVDYQKGCFLGQETVAKIETRRGAANFPMLIEKPSGEFIQKNLKREDRVIGKEVEVDGIRGIVHSIPFFKDLDDKDKAQSLFYRASEKFTKLADEDDHSEVISLLEQAISFDESYADAYESLGVIYGRKQEFQKGIDLMDKLLEVDESSVMAHTNKSLYLMRLGKIEEAEEEKSKAAVKAFAYHGEAAKQQKAEAEAKAQEEAELLKREGMFKEVLEIDPEDALANFGLGDIALSRGQYQKAITHLEKVLESDPKYSVAYLALGKAYEFKGDTTQAKDIYSKGVEIASQKGDLMPANEMQSRLSQL